VLLRAYATDAAGNVSGARASRRLR
jgi:hypothetical protein